MERIQWKRNTMVPSSDKFLSVMDVREVKKVFHNIALLHLYRLRI